MNNKPKRCKKKIHFIDKLNSTIEDDNNEIVLEEITINDIVYYKDIYGGIWDNTSEIVGVIDKSDDTKFTLFNTCLRNFYEYNNIDVKYQH